MWIPVRERMSPHASTSTALGLKANPQLSNSILALFLAAEAL